MLKFSLSNMILLVVIIALLIPHVWNAIPKPPVKFEDSIRTGQSPFQEVILSHPDDREFTVTVPTHTGKRWENLDENPPLSAKDAIELAFEKQKALVEAYPEYHWEMQQAVLCPADPEQGYWYWIVEFEQRKDEGYNYYGRWCNLKLVVLMDGTVVEPTVKTKRKSIARAN